MNNYVFAFSGIVFLFLHKAHAQVTLCTNTQKFGKENPDGKDSLGNTDTYYKICSGLYQFSCCGVIEQWEYTAETAGDVDLQVWRPVTVGSATYRLVHSISHTATSTGNDVDYTVTTNQRFLVKEFDCVGWYSATDIVSYKDGGTRVNADYLPSASVNTAGDVDWSSATQSPAYEWAIGGQLTTPAAPTFSGPTSGSVSDIATVSTDVATVTFADSDYTDELTISINSNTYFDITDLGDKTAKIIVKSSLIPISGNTQVVTITATDLCGQTVTGTVTISVVNDPPQLTGLPQTVDVSEDVPIETSVAVFTCSDSSGSVTTDISEDSGNNPAFFFVKKSDVTDEYAVMARSQTDASQGRFDYNTDRAIDVTVTCCDTVECVTDVITVNMVQNTPPYITNLPDSVEVSVYSNIADVIFTVEFTDDDGDTVNVWAECDPAAQLSNCFVEILDSGHVLISDDIDQTVAGFDLFVNVADQRNNGTSRTLSVIMIDRNNPPQFTNLNNSVIVNDGTPTDQLLFTITATDPEGDALTFQWSQADGGTSYFTLNSTTGEVKTVQEISYEEISPSVLPFIVIVSDGISSATATLTVTIQDANEPFSFSSTVYRGEILEWTAVGTTLSDIVFTMVDGDATDTYTCTMDCDTYSGYFTMLTSCSITVAALYKLDEGLPTEITCSVVAEDSGGNTNTTSVVISIEYDNNYSPVFGSTSYDFSVSSYALANTDLGTVVATDSDLVSYGTFSYSLDTSSQGGIYFKIDGSSGLIRTRSSMVTCDCAGTTFTVPVYATDTGGKVGTSTALITVFETTTVVVTDRYKKFWDDERNIGWFCVLMILLAITTVVTIFVCVKYICMKPCKNPFGRGRAWRPRYFERQTRRPPSPITPAKPRKPELHTIRQPPPAVHSWKKQMGLY